MISTCVLPLIAGDLWSELDFYLHNRRIIPSIEGATATTASTSYDTVAAAIAATSIDTIVDKVCANTTINIPASVLVGEDDDDEEDEEALTMAIPLLAPRRRSVTWPRPSVRGL